MRGHQLTGASTSRSSLPSVLEQRRDKVDSSEASKNYSCPLIRDSSDCQNSGYNLKEQPSIDVDLDNSELDSSSGNSKRQTVILANRKREADTGGDLAVTEEAQAEAEAAIEDSISMESLVFIHIELPLFPLSAFVPKIMQEAAAAKQNK